MALTLLAVARVFLNAFLQFVLTTWPVSLVTRLFRVKNSRERVVVITGCDTGFGNLAARRLDAMGLRVFAGCLTANGAETLKSEASERLTVVMLDVTKPESIREAYVTVQAAVPEGIWALINNAGIVDYSPSDYALMAVYRRVVDVNLFGLVDMTSVFMPLLKLQKGRVVNVASVAGLISAPGMAAYNISKFGVEAYSDALRREVYPFGVGVTVVEPAFMATPLIDVGRATSMQAKGWGALPQWYREEYGDDWSSHQLEAMKKMFSTADNPTKVVTALVDAVTCQWIPHRFLVGRGSRIIKTIAMLPSPIADMMFHLLAETNLPRAVQQQRLAAKLAGASSVRLGAASPSARSASASPSTTSSAEDEGEVNGAEDEKLTKNKKANNKSSKKRS